jgi:putative phosphoesterase
MSTLVGVISDTHGVMRRDALDALEGCDLIIHAGDVGSPQVLEALSTVAPVHAVRGNVDGEVWARDLPLVQIVDVGQVRFRWYTGWRTSALKTASIV